VEIDLAADQSGIHPMMIAGDQSSRFENGRCGIAED